MTAHVPEEHSNLVGGSTASRRVHCPRSLTLEKLAPADKGSPAAREGTALHEYMARLLSSGDEPKRPFTFNSPEGWSFTVDDELWAEKGKPALDAFDTFVERIEADWGAPFEMLIEQKCQFPGLEGAYGTSDIVGRCGPEVFIMDWKFGQRPVDADRNWQLMFYAVSAMASLPKFLAHEAPTDFPTDPRPVTCVIIQPMAKDGVILKPWETDVDELAEMAEELREAIGKAVKLGNDAPVMKGKHCDFARCKVVCPLYVGDAVAMTTKFAALKNRLDGPVEPAEAVDFGKMLAEMIALADDVEEWAAAVHKAAHSYAEDGGEVPGYKLVEKKAGGRSWKVDAEDVAKFFKNRGFKLDEYMPRSLVSMPAGERLANAAGKTIPDAMIAPGVPAGTKLVRADNPGTEAVTTAKAATALAERIAAYAAQLN